MKYFERILTYGSLSLLLLLFGTLAALLSPLKESKVTIGRIEFRVTIADEPTEWRRGLIGHQPLQEGEGMFFIFPSAQYRTFHMKDMGFPIDIIWIAEGRVVGFADHALPDDGQALYNSPGMVDRVLEISAGERERLGIAVGAPVSVE